VLAVRGALHRPVRGGVARCGICGDAALPDVAERRRGRVVVRAEAVALVRLHRLRREPVQPPDHRLRRRVGPAEAGVGRDGGGDESRGAGVGAADRPGDETRVSQGDEAGAGSQVGCVRVAGAEPGPGADPVHDLDAAVQPDALADGGRTRSALGPGAGGRRCGARGGPRDDAQRLRAELQLPGTRRPLRGRFGAGAGGRQNATARTRGGRRPGVRTRRY